MAQPLSGPQARRALELLWTDPRRGARGPERGLTTARIVEVALELVEAEGLDALSMRAVAARLGIGTASLYTYLPGRAELEALMLDAVAIGPVLPHEWPGDWRAKLEAWARDDWHAIRERPWTLLLGSGEQLPGPRMLRWLDSALMIFDGTGLSEGEKLAAIESVDAYVRGLARLHLEDGAPGSGRRAGEEPAGEGDGGRQRDEILGRLVDFDRYPALRRALAAGAVPFSGDRFDFGLARLLDGIAGLIESREPPAAPERRSQSPGSGP
ncbi:TetR/AcrR family transcriptional regulator [Streptomyces sp. NPDC014894]|uniref:TetR/AcrR family transcriptional regulator n=1 Tax=Streptomyces sp. NPDC014894 TaxID=3364931 RepID=UPI003700F211